MPYLEWPVTTEAKFNPRSVRVGLVADRMPPVKDMKQVKLPI